MLTRSIIQRSLATAHATATHAAYPAKYEQKITKISNGMTLASIETNGPVSHLVLTFRAGTRYEQPDERGLVHRLRNAIGSDSGHYSGMNLLWQASSCGANLTATASKDFLSLHMAVVSIY